MDGGLASAPKLLVSTALASAPCQHLSALLHSTSGTGLVQGVHLWNQKANCNSESLSDSETAPNLPALEPCHS